MDEIDRAAYRESYEAGWRASERPRNGDLTDAEDRYLARHGHANESLEHNAWLDGWTDHAAGRDKWHMETCGEDHHNDEGGCGVA